MEVLPPLAPKEGSKPWARPNLTRGFLRPTPLPVFILLYYGHQRNVPCLVPMDDFCASPPCLSTPFTLPKQWVGSIHQTNPT